MQLSKNFLIGVSAFVASTSLIACGSDRAASTGVTTVTGAVSLIEAGVEEAGSGLASTSLMNAANSKINKMSLTPFSGGFSPMFATTPFEAALCDTRTGEGLGHGWPMSDADTRMSNSDGRFPLAQTYCSLTVNDGDTVRGGFSLAKSLICTLEAGGITFTGSTQSINSNFSDTTCWPDGGPESTDVTLSAVGTTNPTWAPYFSKGVSFTVAALGLTYKIAANLDGEAIEFIGNESWDNGNSGVMSGSINKTTGVLKFEKRDERITSDCASNSCGWNRHTRIYADLTLDASGNPNGVESLEYANSEARTNAAAYADPTNVVASGAGGFLVTAKGTVATALKGRYFSTADTSANGVYDISNWSETANTACGTGAGGIVDGAGADCSGAEAGIAMFSDPATFVLRGTHKTPTEWLNEFGGFNFTGVDVDTDAAFAAQ